MPYTPVLRLGPPNGRIRKCQIKVVGNANCADNSQWRAYLNFYKLLVPLLCWRKRTSTSGHANVKHVFSKGLLQLLRFGID